MLQLILDQKVVFFWPALLLEESCVLCQEGCCILPKGNVIVWQFKGMFHQQAEVCLERKVAVYGWYNCEFHLLWELCWKPWKPSDLERVWSLKLLRERLLLTVVLLWAHAVFLGPHCMFSFLKSLGKYLEPAIDRLWIVNLRFGLLKDFVRICTWQEKVYLDSMKADEFWSRRVIWILCMRSFYASIVII